MPTAVACRGPIAIRETFGRAHCGRTDSSRFEFWVAFLERPSLSRLARSLNHTERIVSESQTVQDDGSWNMLRPNCRGKADLDMAKTTCLGSGITLAIIVLVLAISKLLRITIMITCNVRGCSALAVIGNRFCWRY